MEAVALEGLVKFCVVPSHWLLVLGMEAEVE